MIKKFICFINNSSRIRYIISGSFSTIFTPAFFLFLSSFISPKIAILISEIIINFFRFIIITLWVFESRIDNKSIFAYLKATVPIVIFNFIFVSLFEKFLGTFILSILLAFFSVTVGFCWNKICYRKTEKKRKTKLVFKR